MGILSHVSMLEVRRDKSHDAHFFFSPFLLSLPSPQVVSAIPSPSQWYGLLLDSLEGG
jgi:hypothetical protein